MSLMSRRHHLLPRLIATMGLLTACGKDTPAPAPTPDVPAAPAPAADADAPPQEPPPDAAPEVTRACDAPEVTAGLASLRPDVAVRKADGSLRLCGGTGGESRGCLVYTPVADPSARKDGHHFERSFLPLPDDDFDHVPAFPPGFDDAFGREDGKPITKICIDPAAGCKDIYVGRAVAGHFDADKKRAVLTTLADDDTRVVRVFDTETLAETLAIPLPGTSLIDCSFGAFLGESLLVATGPCTTAEGGKAWLVDPATGEKKAELGKDGAFAVRDGQFTPLDGTRWALRRADGGEVLIVDVATGETAAQVATGRDADKVGREKAWLFADGDRLVMVEAQPTKGELVLMDTKGATLVAREAPQPCE
jgi:hypothetical protein